MNRLICSADRLNRQIVFHLRPEFGDDRDASGLPLVPGEERRMVHKIFDDAVDHCIGSGFGREVVKHWAEMSRFVNPGDEFYFDFQARRAFLHDRRSWFQFYDYATDDEWESASSYLMHCASGEVPLDATMFARARDTAIKAGMKRSLEAQNGR